MVSRISLTAGLLLLCAIAPGGDAVEAAGIGVQLGVHGHNIPRAVASGHNPHIGREWARGRHRTCIRPPEVFSAIQRTRVRRSNCANERSM